MRCNKRSGIKFDARQYVVGNRGAKRIEGWHYKTNAKGFIKFTFYTNKVRFYFGGPNVSGSLSAYTAKRVSDCIIHGCHIDVMVKLWRNERWEFVNCFKLGMGTYI